MTPTPINRYTEEERIANGIAQAADGKVVSYLAGHFAALLEELTGEAAACEVRPESEGSADE